MKREEFFDWFQYLKDDPQPYFDKEKMAFVFDLFFCVVAVAMLMLIANVILRNVLRVQLYCLLQDLTRAIIHRLVGNEEEQRDFEQEEEEEEDQDLLENHPSIIRDTVVPTTVEIAMKTINNCKTGLDVVDNKM